MLPRNHPDRIRIAFDDHRLVANAGLVLPATLALRLPQLLQKHLDLGNAPGRANTGNKMIFALPRRTTGVAWAEKNGGLLLQLIPGSDTVLQLAMARVILENGWEDSEFIERWVANAWEIDAGMGRGSRNTPWQWRTTWGKLGADFQEYKEWLFQQPHAELDRAAEITGVPADLIVRAAEMLAKPVDGQRPKASFGLEKGNYWSNNYGNTASFAALALICGSGNRPGRVVSRMGGHQRGWIGAAPYPIDKSPNRLPGRRRQEIDLDRWVESGNVRFAWVIGTTWINAMAASHELYDTLHRMTRRNEHQLTMTDVDQAAATLIARAASGGMVVAVQDIYLQSPIGDELADIVLPASTWGENDFARCNGERRLRLYSKFNDPPGDSRPDWWIIAQFARKMGFEGYDWQDSNQVFEEAARSSRGTVLDYFPLVRYAQSQGRRAHDVLRDMGTTGIQTPVRMVNGELAGTKRLHDSTLELGAPEGPTVHRKWLTHFGTHSGKAVLNKSPWEWFSDFYERITPRSDELWVTNGRINELWQSAYDDSRKPNITQRWPDNYVEIHPDDAASRGIESGDEVIMESDDILVQTGGFTLVKGDEFLFNKLQENGLIRCGKGSSKAVAMVTDAAGPGCERADGGFLHPVQGLNTGQSDPAILQPLLRELEKVREQGVLGEALPHLRKRPHGDFAQTRLPGLLQKIQGLSGVRRRLTAPTSPFPQDAGSQETLPRLQQRPVHAEMLLREQ